MLRSFRERMVQTLCFEVGGLVVATPVYALVTGTEAWEGLAVVAAIAGVILIWLPIHNFIFDWAEWRLAARVASDRPHRWRMVHAISQEVTAAVVSVPVLMGLGGLSFWAALLMDLGLTAVYAVYGYAFHLVYDRLRPVTPARSVGGHMG